jgi:hypothetical protein
MAPSSSRTHKKKRSKKKSKDNEEQSSFEHTAEEKCSKDTGNTATGTSTSTGKAATDSSSQQQPQQQQPPPQQQQQHRHYLQSYNDLPYHNKDSPLLVMPPDDAIEDTSFDDPYVYSDDSGSLSDAYFFPDHDSIHAKYSENDYDHDRTQPYAFSSKSNHHNYGSTTDRRPQSPMVGPMVPSRITLNGILEDSPLHEVTPLVPTAGATTTTGSATNPKTDPPH